MPKAPPADPVDEPVVVFLDADGATEPGPEPQEPRSRGLLRAGIVGAVAGAAITAAAFLVSGTAQEDLPVTWETFPEEILGLDREDLFPRLIDSEFAERFDDYFARQLENHHFAHGGDGAEVGYVGPNGETQLRLTIVNGYVAPPIPWQPDAAQDPGESLQRTVILGDVRCTVDTYYWASGDVDDMSEFEAPNCVLNDEIRGLGLRLQGPLGYWSGDTEGFSVEGFAEALVAVHSSLVG